MHILGFSGKAQHGKDTCALLARDIASDMGYVMGSWALAHPLKAIVYGEQGGTFSFQDVWVNKPPEVRKLLQRRGTEEGRQLFGESYWTLQSEAYIKLFSDCFPEIQGIIFTDIRFPNEVSFIKAGGKDLPAYQIQYMKTYLENLGFGDYWEVDPEDKETMLEYLLAEEKAVTAAQESTNYLLNNSPGMALYIESDRPTLTGDAANHPSYG